MPSLSHDLCQEALHNVKGVLGDVAVVVFDNSQKKYVAVKGVFTTPSAALISRLRDLLGEENVILQ